MRFPTAKPHRTTLAAAVKAAFLVKSYQDNGDSMTNPPRGSRLMEVLI